MVGEAPAGPERSRSAGLVVRLLVLALVGGALWYGMARIDWPALWSAVAASNPLWILAGIVAALLSHLLRAHRWRLLIPDGRHWLPQQTSWAHIDEVVRFVEQYTSP